MITYWLSVRFKSKIVVKEGGLRVKSYQIIYKAGLRLSRYEYEQLAKIYLE